jgi:chemotaxis protein CheD
MSPATPVTAGSDQIVVGVGDLKVSNGVGESVITYALGSCLGITAYDPVAKAGGLLHVMLPSAAVDRAKARERPYMFVDSGVPLLFRTCYELGAKKPRMVVKVCGGASTHGDPASDYFKIGARNIAALKQILWKNGVMIEVQDVGGSHSRTMSLEIGTGRVTVRSQGTTRAL